jgi:hypothetical protein
VNVFGGRPQHANAHMDIAIRHSGPNPFDRGRSGRFSLRMQAQ